MEGAFLHIVGDLMGSIAVVVGGILVITLDLPVIDPILGALIGLLILLTSGRLLWKVLRVLMQGTPSHLLLTNVCQLLEQVEGVTGVHDIHLWSLTSGYEVLSAHVTTDVTPLNRGHLLHRLQDIASKELGITHATLQIEDSSERCAERHHFPHANS